VLSASLVPGDMDPTVLFTTAGMHPLVPFLLGEKHPSGKKRLAGVQKCIRTADIEEVGDTSHLTFFEMLGNWSLGDYFKKEAIEMSWEFLTDKKWLGLDKNKLAVSVFEGDDDAPFDEEAFGLWQKRGVPAERIAKLPKKDNWWGPAGETGPCGPDTEMFYWTGGEPAPEKFDPENKKWVEIWNDVFMEYNKKEDGTYEFLSQKNVDTGMGLERVAMIMQGKSNVYETDVFAPLMEKVREILPTIDIKSRKIISDHIKASVFILANDVEPSNTGRGYVLRRLVRRAVARANMNDLNFDSEKFKLIAQTVFDIYRDIYPEFMIEEKCTDILDKLSLEVRKFRKTIEKGFKEFEKYYRLGVTAGGDYSNLPETLKGEAIFNLVTTHGFPLELIEEIARERGLVLDIDNFNVLIEKHQELSRTASAGMFKGGLADSSEETTKLHTATHLLLSALRLVLGEHVEQKGSNITEKRLRLDFSHPEKLTDGEKKEIEDLVNQKIKENLSVSWKEMTLEDAKKSGAIGVFESKYGDKVKVYSAGHSAGLEPPFSREICGGPHVENTGALGKFKITKEEASSAGVRRIKAVLE